MKSFSLLTIFAAVLAAAYGAPQGYFGGFPSQAAAQGDVAAISGLGTSALSLHGQAHSAGHGRATSAQQASLTNGYRGPQVHASNLNSAQSGGFHRGYSPYY